MPSVDLSGDNGKRAADRYAALALSLFRIRGFADPGGDRLGQIVHGALAGATADELRSADGISAATIGRLDQLVTSAVEADRPRNIHSSDAARLAQLGAQGAAGALGTRAFAELQRSRLDGRDAREGNERGEGRDRGAGRSGDRYAALPVAGDGVSGATMGAYVQSYAGTGLGRSTVQTFAEVGLQRGVYDAYRKEGFSREDIGDAAKTTRTLGWKHDRQAFDDVQRSSQPERAAIVAIDREKDAEKRKTLIETKRSDLHIDEKPQAAQERWQRNIDRVQQHHHDADQRHGVGASAKLADSSLEAGRAAEHGKPATAKVRVAKLEASQAKNDKASAKAMDDGFGTATTPAKVAAAKPAATGPKIG